MEKQIQLFVNVDSLGNIILNYSGENIIATESFDFFFLVDEEIANNLTDYHVVMSGFKATLQLK